MEGLHSCIVSGSAGHPGQVLDRLTDHDLEELTVALQTHVRAADAWLVHAIAEVDRRRIPNDTYALTTRQWLRRFCRQTASDAGSTLKAARRLAAMPNIAKRALAGEIPPSSVRILSAASARHPEAFAVHEETFADTASYLDTRDLGRAVDHWRQQVDHAAVVRDIGRRRDRRRAAIHQTIDGMWHHEGLYDPESGHTISAALRARVDPWNLDPDDRRTHSQRMADALTDVCRFWLDHNREATTSGGTKPHITVTIDVDALHARTAVDLPTIDGTPVDVETIRRLACDAAVVRILTSGAGQPLDVGRTVRTVTPAIRRALDVRDSGCTWKGCDIPAGWCDAHHRIHWADGGATSLDNMMLLCRKHHRAVHEGGDPIGGRRAPP